MSSSVYVSSGQHLPISKQLCDGLSEKNVPHKHMFVNNSLVMLVWEFMEDLQYGPLL